jgi:hypothetical protein
MDSASSGSLQISVRTAMWGLDLKGVIVLKSMLSEYKNEQNTESI